MIKALWKGSFSYDEADYGKSRVVNFSMEVEQDGNTFSGISYDDEYKTLSDQPASVEGTIIDDMISFIIRYPIPYLEDENGVLKLDHASEPYDIFHDGYFDERTNKWSGNWEFEMKTENGSYFLTGYFELSRDQEASKSLIEVVSLN